MNLLIVSGLSGAGKSVAMNALEDIGFFCIDNIRRHCCPASRRFRKRVTTSSSGWLSVWTSAAAARRKKSKKLFLSWTRRG